jgi:hypothetical protein
LCSPLVSVTENASDQTVVGHEALVPNHMALGPSFDRLGWIRALAVASS